MWTGGRRLNGPALGIRFSSSPAARLSGSLIDIKLLESFFNKSESALASQTSRLNTKEISHEQGPD